MKRKAMVVLILLALAGPVRGNELRLSSPAFKTDTDVPPEHTCDGADRSPAVEWRGAPEATKAFALLVEDPDAPSGVFVHWVVYNIPGAAGALDQGVENRDTLGDGTRQGKNDFGNVGYGGPCPPPGSKHHYEFRLFALAASLDLDPGASAASLRQAMQGKILAEARLVGLYQRQKAK